MIIEHNQNNIQTQFKNIPPSMVAVLCKERSVIQKHLYVNYVNSLYTL